MNIMADSAFEREECAVPKQDRFVPKPIDRECRDCGVLLDDGNQYPSCRKRGQHCCKGCWNKRFYIAVRKHKYGLSKAEFFGLLELQDFSCAICGNRLREDEACVDHDHDTGEVRGILCRTCNSGIGMLKDSPELLRSAIDYLDGEYMKKRRAK